MTGKTHQAIGLLGGACANLYNFSNPIGSLFNLVFVSIGSALPDFDLLVGIKHRTITHSLPCLIVLTFLLKLFYPAGLLPFVIGYSSHLVADSFTKSGVPLLYPIKYSFGVKILTTNSWVETVLRFLCYILTIAYLLPNFFSSYNFLQGTVFEPVKGFLNEVFRYVNVFNI
jgi:inner membrane protein